MAGYRVKLLLKAVCHQICFVNTRLQDAELIRLLRKPTLRGLQPDVNKVVRIAVSNLVAPPIVYCWKSLERFFIVDMPLLCDSLLSPAFAVGFPFCFSCNVPFHIQWQPNNLLSPVYVLKRRLIRVYNSRNKQLKIIIERISSNWVEKNEAIFFLQMVYSNASRYQTVIVKQF